ncbi:MAG: RNA polymerase sigma factor [Candidatus Zhuqueibacterota bacterium]
MADFSNVTHSAEIRRQKRDRATPMDELELLEKLKSGQADAFKFLVDAYHEKVLNTCFRFLNNKEDAEDLAQEVFVTVYRSVGDFRGESKISSWIYRIAVTRSLDAYRRKNRKKRFAKMQRLIGLKENEDALQIPDAQNPSAELEDKERAAILQRALNGLPENQRAVITLNKYEGFSQKEIADIMGTSVSSVESLMHRGKKNLFKRLYAYYDKII